MLKVRQLEVFRAVMKTGSVSGAARTMNVSQPAVTKTLQLLEGRIGLPLFMRIKGRLQCTPEAEALLPEIERMFGSLDSIDHVASELRGGYAGRIAIASSATLTSSLVPAAIQRFRRNRPRIRFEIRALASRHVIEEVRNSQVDLGVLDFPLGGEDFEAYDLCCGEIGCVMRIDHPLAQRKSIAPKDLCDQNLIGFSETTFTGSSIHEAFRAANVSCQISYTTNQTFSAYALVQGGAGIAIVDPFPLLSGAFADLVIRPFHPTIEIRPRVILPRNRPVSQVSRWFVDEMVQVTKELVANSKRALAGPRIKEAGKRDQKAAGRRRWQAVR
jgi:DNA-binding transcriptional LysR family regulator